MKIRTNTFNPLYWHLQNFLSNEDIRYLFILGGSSASKTFSISQAEKFETYKTNNNTMILRKFSVDIDDSIFNDFKDISSRYGIENNFKFTKHLIRNNKSGSYIRFRGLDDSEKIKGLSGFKRVHLEEISQFQLEDFKQIRKRLRGKRGQQIIATMNPISENHWIKTEIIDKQKWIELPKEINGCKYSKLDSNSYVRINEKGNTILIKTTYLDNFWVVGHPEFKTVGFIDKHVIEDFEFDKENDYDYYRVYALGEWGTIRTGLEMYKHFREVKTVKNIEYNPKLPLHITFDENVNPYLTCLISQCQGNRISFLNEICLKPPKNNLEYTITEIKQLYPNNSGILIYGDATSQKQDTKLQQGINFYRLIENYLNEYQLKNMVMKSNPSVMLRCMFIDKIFNNDFTGIEIEISQNCKNLINDLKKVKQAADGTKLKEVIRDKQTGATFQEFGHCTDAMEYLIIKYFEREYLEFINKRKTTQKIIK